MDDESLHYWLSYHQGVADEAAAECRRATEAADVYAEIISERRALSSLEELEAL